MGSDHSAFTTFVVDQRPGLVILATLMLGDASRDAEDVVQVALERLASRWGRVRDPSAYVRRSIANLVVDHHRRSQRRPEKLLGNDREFRTLVERGVAELDAAVEVTDEVWALICNFPPRQRQVLALRYIDDRTDVEVAKILGIPLGTVKSDCYRGLRAIRARASQDNHATKGTGAETCHNLK